MEPSNIQLITFPSFNTKNGVLSMVQHAGNSKTDNLPFPIKRALITRGMRGADVRGGHTHFKTQQILFALTGACTVNLDDGTKKEQVRIDSPDKGLVLKPYVWHTMENFSDNTTLLILADTEYDENDYIRNYDEFLQIIKKKRNDSSLL